MISPSHLVSLPSETLKDFSDSIGETSRFILIESATDDLVIDYWIYPGGTNAILGESQ